MSGKLTVGGNGSVEFKEDDGIDYAAVTVQLPGGERVPFLFTVKQLDAKGTVDSFSGDFNVPSYRGSSFLDPKVRGATAAAAAAAGCRQGCCFWWCSCDSSFYCATAAPAGAAARAASRGAPAAAGTTARGCRAAAVAHECPALPWQVLQPFKAQ